MIRDFFVVATIVAPRSIADVGHGARDKVRLDQEARRGYLYQWGRKESRGFRER